MAERDPFGRLPDENPLAGLGSLSDNKHSEAAQPVVVEAKEDWSGVEPAAAQAKPAAAAAAAAAAKPAMSASSGASSSAPPPRTGNPMVDQSLAEVIRQAEAMSGVKVVQSVRVVSRVVKLAVFLVVLAVIASVAGPLISVSKDVRDAVDDIPSSVEIPGSDSSSAGSEDEAEQAVPTGLSSRSMLTRRNFDRAMDRLSKSGLGRMRSMSIRPERIDAQLLTKGGSLRSVQIRSDDPEINDSGAGSPGFSHLDTIPFAKIDTGAPARLARSAAGRLKKPASQIDYVVLLSFADKPMWSAFSKSGKHFLANAHGKITRRIN